MGSGMCMHPLCVHMQVCVQPAVVCVGPWVCPHVSWWEACAYICVLVCSSMSVCVCMTCTHSSVCMCACLWVCAPHVHPALCSDHEPCPLLWFTTLLVTTQEVSVTLMGHSSQGSRREESGGHHQGQIQRASALHAHLTWHSCYGPAGSSRSSVLCLPPAPGTISTV